MQFTPRILRLALTVGTIILSSVFMTAAAAQKNDSNDNSPDVTTAVATSPAENEREVTDISISHEEITFDGPDWEPAGFTDNNGNVGWSGSVMFPLKDLQSLNKVIDAYRRGLESNIDDPNATKDAEETADDPLNKILEELAGSQYQDEPQASETPYFHLGSIVYVSPDSWSVWLNGTRITPATLNKIDDVEIMEVRKHKVKIRWKPHSIESVQSVWNKNMENPENFDKLGVEDFNIDFHRDRTVTFILHPNQTLYTDVMEIVEGRRMEPRSLMLQRMRSENDEENGGDAAAAGKYNKNTTVGEAANYTGSGVVARERSNADKLINQYINAGEALGLIPTSQ